MKTEHSKMSNLIAQTTVATVSFVVLTSVFRLALDAATGESTSPVGWLVNIVVGAVVFAAIYYVARRRAGAANGA
jgi:riboflavin transporter FmnP